MARGRKRLSNRSFGDVKKAKDGGLASLKNFKKPQVVS